MRWSNRLLARNNNGRQTNFQTSNDNEIAYKQTNFQTSLFLPRTMECKLYKIENTYFSPHYKTMKTYLESEDESKGGG
ncbi:hypothetical protein RHMOL_Rhmol05G0070400 [Rhododendron molle]|uniref:Uncharacterized protein n=1 Tax=Rhododendron molle TaxID=49168 RepID=A0ACC0NM74_RHOML|nr:hypothetical protein RHMOL_Rhmol05G0070400 [Rhododendron molle]